MTVLSRIYSQGFLRNSSRISNLYIRPVRNFRKKADQGKSKKVETPEVETAEVKIHGRGTSDQASPGILRRYVIYTAVSVPAIFTGCAIWQYETSKKVSTAQLRRLHVDIKQYGFRNHINDFWNRLLPTQKLAVEIIAANVVIFLLWKVSMLRPFMNRYFLCMPTKAQSVLSSTMSVFSHISAFHLFANMYVLWSFSTPLSFLLGKEQFLAVYLAGGTIGGLTSCVHRVMTGVMVPSVGASAAILSSIAIVCLRIPESRLSIAFVDQVIPHSFSAKSALIAILVLDCVGIARGWRVLDHAGHLGGVLFGMLYSQYGTKLVWHDYKHALLKKYHKLRNKMK